MASVVVATVAMLLAMGSFAGVEAVNLRQDQYTVLQAAKSAWGSFNGSTTWTGYDCDKQYTGVQCDSQGYVIEIALPRAGVTGSVGYIASLTRLQYLDLSFNGGLSTAAEDFGSLSALKSLLSLNLRYVYDVIHYYPSGTVSIYHFTGLTNLRFLDLSINSMRESIPANISNLQALTHLNLGGNWLDGSVPASFSRLSDLSSLTLASNLLTGNLSPLRTLVNLEHLELQGNSFSGALPRYFSSFGSLQHLDVSSNKLTGRIFSSLAYLTSLTFLSLADNYLYSYVPRVLNSLTNLVHLRLHTNFLYGNLPWFNITSLQELDVHDNYLTGNLRRINMLLPASNMSDNFFLGTNYDRRGSFECNVTTLLRNCLNLTAWSSHCSTFAGGSRQSTQRPAATCRSFCNTDISSGKQCGGLGVCVPVHVTFNFTSHSFSKWSTRCHCYPGYSLSANNQTCVVQK